MDVLFFRRDINIVLNNSFGMVFISICHQSPVPSKLLMKRIEYLKLEPHLVIHVIFDFNQVCILWEKEGHMWL
jgi:hypothetical protein